MLVKVSTTAYVFPGTGFGLVTDGPFANFSTDENPLKRSIGQGSGSLMKPQKVEAMFKEGFCRMGVSNITVFYLNISFSIKYTSHTKIKACILFIVL
jgi:hypothetical protein